MSYTVKWILCFCVYMSLWDIIPQVYSRLLTQLSHEDDTGRLVSQ